MRVIYVDDEQPALETFRMKVKDFPEIESLHLFSEGEDALRFSEDHRIDTAFLDIEMPGMDGITLAGEAIACLWPHRPADEKTQTLYRVTFHQLMEELKRAGIENIIQTKGKKKSIVMDMVECDLYWILDGKTDDMKNYDGYYLKEYDWAETRNGQLTGLKMNRISFYNL